MPSEHVEGIEAAAESAVAEVHAEQAAVAAETAVLAARSAIALAEVEAAAVQVEAAAEVAEVVEQVEQHEENLSWLRSEISQLRQDQLETREALSGIQSLLISMTSGSTSSNPAPEETTAKPETTEIEVTEPNEHGRHAEPTPEPESRPERKKRHRPSF